MADRALGNPLGNPLGLPKAAGFQPEATTYTRIVSGEGVLIPPKGAKLMRVAVIGGGGCGYYTGSKGYGGGGGACAATKIVPAAEILYSVGAGGTPSSPHGQDSTASFAGYTLVGGGGRAYVSGTAVAGGVATGGDYNHAGGSTARTGSYQCGGGGGAGPHGPGGGGGDVNMVPPSADGWGAPGGFGGGGSDQGAGAGASYFQGYRTTCFPWGSGHSDSNGYSAGELGGGGRSGATSGYSNIGKGGPGGIVVEWFY